MRKYLILLGILLMAFQLSAQKFTISGKVKDAANGEELIGATIFIKGLKTGTVTNEYGYFSLSLDKDDYEIEINYLGFEAILQKVVLDKDHYFTFELAESSSDLQEVEVTGERIDRNVKSNEMSNVKLQSKTIKKIPAFMGEVDLVKVIQLLPGVQSTSEGSSGFSVRGGSPDQNLILLDEATVYNASHLMGFFSVFNNDAIKDVKIYKGDIPAAHGGRLSSLLDVRMRDGNSKKISVTGGIGSISSRLTIEGPIVKDKTTFLVSGRRTYADLFLRLSSNEDLKNNILNFYDLNAKVNHTFNKKNRLYLSFYMGQDKFANDFAKLYFGNRTSTIRWNHLFSDKLFFNFTFTNSVYNYNLGTPEGNPNAFDWKSRMTDYGVRGDFTYFLNPQNTVKFGLEGTYHIFEPGSAKGLGEEALFTEFVQPKNYALDYAFYISNEQKIGERIQLKYGLRLSVFQNIGPGTIYNFDDNYDKIDSTVYPKGEIFNTYMGLEPRFGISYLLNDYSSIKVNYSRTRQSMQLAQNSTAGTPLDIWFPASPNVKPQIADQVALGYFRNFNENAVETSVEVYYKNMKNAIDFKDFAEVLLNEQLEGELRFGKAWSYGIEFLIRKNVGKLTGWISYTYSKTERRFEDINRGNVYPAPYDKPHDVSIVMSYGLNERLDLSANWVYATGQPATFPTGRAHYGNTIVPIYSDRNAYRMRDYHRLDVSATWRKKQKEGSKFDWDINLSVYNAYARHNTWSINFIQDENDPNVTYAEQTYLFSIIPALTFNFKF
ncbi:TonB-dependent receptor [Lentimicrobium sp. L6]|uniref:TonB-dependent receptor n=1 Tax=Lentimicrobium sp. L6 TaxID=2735916 RepID=UPI0015521FD8|nr:TonB-dependent receptor [Lentimicrobium sp. L6]NPD83333.1 TonB-dependent receptor [Lentimicrobium sp. L6]